MTMMITRTLLAALCCACACALTPLAPLHPAGDNSDCALYLSGPARSSAYDYSINLLKGNFGYDRQSNCITYEAINQAYLEARNRILVSQPKGDWKAEDFASVGELILDISTNLARRYGLTYEEIEKGLPLIDTSRTLIREVCPPIFSHVECRAGKYRRLDGLCNNLQHPTWGATMAPFQRLIGPLFADGINAPRIAHHGKDLPLSRVVSRTMHPDEGFHDHAGTVMVIAWGQFMDHDYTLTATPLDPVNRNDPEECCKRPPHLKHPYCNEIRIPDDDYFYRLFGVKCIDFVRGFPSPRPGCRLGSRNPFNTLTGVIDGNTVYGVTEKFARKLRTGFGGLLRMNPVFKEYGLKDLLPLKLDIPDEGCTRPNKNMYCFEAGEIRVNEQLVLTVMHTLMAREHNRVANALAEVNPHWDDETLFQEARRINIAEIQHITYNEFLPILLGKDVMEKFGLVLAKEGYWDGYDPEVNPDVIASFAAAAYRFGHSLLPTAVERWSKAHKFIASKRLSDLIRRPYDLYRAGVLDEYVMGLMNQVAQAMDDSITQEVTNHLFKKVGARFGMDLVSFNMQRGREFGLPGYMEFRKFCGLPPADTFQDLFGSMPNATVQKYETIFDHPIDVDLWSGGVSERPLPGSMLGPTFACVIATQFSYSRRGDRFWFELPNQPSSFTPEQLVEIRKARLARVICDNTDIIDTVQLYPMVLPDHELNPRVPCRSGIIPQMDFSKWAEPAPFHGAAKQFMTNATVFENNSTSSDTNKNNINTTETTNEKITTQKENKISSLLNNNNIKVPYKNQENDPTINHAVKNDTILNYVYKKGETDIPSKSTGHYKNSLKRRKRSPIESHSNSPLPSKFQKAAVIVDYETSHGQNTGRNANFNIGTRNENSNRNSVDDESLDEASSESNERDNYKLRRGNKKYSRESDESDEQDDYSNRKNENSHENENYRHSSPVNDDSSERDARTHRDGYRSRKPRRRNESIKRKRIYKPSNEREDSGEPEHYSSKPNREREGSGERADYINNRSNLANNHNNAESDENKSSGRYSSPNSDSRESKENQKYSSESKESEENNSNYRHNVNPHDRNLEIQDNTSHDYRNADSSEHKKAKSLESSESSSESNERTEENSKLQNSSPAPISDIDLNNFSYERIHVNKDGKVEPIKENLDNTDPNSSVELLPISTPTPSKETNNQNIINTLTAIHTLPKPAIGHDNDKLVNINDGEVRPVVEIHSENDNGSSEENNKASLSNSGEIESLESILGVKEPENLNNNGQNNKIVVEKEQNGDVKQQFERIPLNYKHNQNNKNKDQSRPNVRPIETTEAPKDENIDLFNNPGTLDVFKPEVRYDDNLNIKFDDVAVTLPEINLPDDILAYTRENSPYNNENQEKQQPKPDTPRYSPYYYNYEDKEAPAPQKKKNDDDDTDDGPRYYGYYGEPDKRQNYKKKNPDDEEEEEEEEEEQEDEDLYEKFVRERFGKRGTFEKRTEQLQQEPADPQLYKTIKNILKKTADIDEQAKKSGDPNAAYMWTLEYGEKL